MSIAICLMGPTAAGKTDIAIELAQRLPCDIISVDSALVYRGLDIGTAKPSSHVLKQAPHRLIDIRDPADPYSVGQFYEDAKQEITNIVAQQRTPFLVGGTMMYFHALQQGLSQLPQSDANIRAQLTEKAESLGWMQLHAELAMIDPATAQRIHPNDAQRIQRALEVYYLTGETLTDLYAKQTAVALKTPMLNIAIAPQDRDWLHKRIEQRFHQLIALGFIDEVEQLKLRGDLSLDTPAMRAVGYRQVWEYLEGKLNRAEMLEQGITATRQLAKRQLTWLRSWSDLNWFDSTDSHLMDKIFAFIHVKIN